MPLDSHQPVPVLRDGKRVTLDVVAKALPKSFAANCAAPAAEEGKESETNSFQASKLGVEVADVSADEAESLGLKGHQGVLITKVDPDGPAAGQGLKPGMLITKIGKKPVKDVWQFQAALGHESLKDGILLWVRSKAGNQLIVVQDSQ